MAFNQDPEGRYFHLIAGIPEGWVGGFAESNPAFAYPHPNLTSLGPLKDNLHNISKLTRQQAVLWPEFSWLTEPENPPSPSADPNEDKNRCFQMFAPDISRLGYDDTGRVWSIICPQQGACLKDAVCMNVEVTVTGNRGWADETNRELAADMTVDGTIWFGPSSQSSPALKDVLNKYNHLLDSLANRVTGLIPPFPLEKKHGIKVTTHAVGKPGQEYFALRDGETKDFQTPSFSKHPEAWTVGNLSVQIGPVRPTGYSAVDAFNQKVVDIFNLGSANMLKDGNVLTWNVWFTAPELVDTKEWLEHAEKWREAIDADHGPVGSKPRYYNGTEYSFENSFEEEMAGFFEKEMTKHLPGDLKHIFE